MTPLSIQSAALPMPASPPSRRLRWPWLLGLAALVAGLHGAVLWQFGPAWIDPDRFVPPAVPLQVRSVALLAAPPSGTPPEQARARLGPPGAPAGPAAPAAPALGVAPAPQVDRNEAASSGAVLATPAGATMAPEAADAIEIPVYATRPAPAGQWRYQLQRGLAMGEATLAWSTSVEAGYALRLEGQIAGLTMLEWISQGRLDHAGVAPERFVLRRRGRDAQAANFQREAGKISFSGPRHEWPLLAGAQDRLSWMMQLPAIIAAAPERYAGGQRIVLLVVGARGDADVWVFEVVGTEMLGDAPTLKLLREARKPYDIRVELWLDPAEHHLPLRVVQTPGGGGAALVLQRRRGAP